MDELGGGLRAAGVPAARIHRELFSGGESQTPGVVPAPRRSPHPPAGPPGPGPLVSFARSGLAARWDPAYGSVLELAEACDVPVRWSCRTGVCHSCESGLLAGTVAYEPEPLDLPAGGNCLICCGRPRSDVVIDI
jgi:ferredoxin